MEKKSPKNEAVQTPKSICDVIRELDEEALKSISRMELIRLIVTANQNDSVNSKAQEQLIGNFIPHAPHLKFGLTLQTRVVPSRDC